MVFRPLPPVLALLQVFDRKNGQDLLLRGDTLVGILAGQPHWTLPAVHATAEVRSRLASGSFCTKSLSLLTLASP